ncbi:MAG: hypothetical protein B6245_05770 [Desulfobacteraceae bacterium 4572_88]|nr:MAG: hypothetical protein B6245_05770 [Desulfobacteraceae bacterium 4572_88]
MDSESQLIQPKAKIKENREILNRLDSERVQRIKAASLKLLNNDDLEGAERDLAWVETSSKVIVSIQKTERFFWLVTIGFIVLLFVGLACTLSIFSTQVSFEVVTESLTLTLDKEWAAEEWSKRNPEFIPSQVVINNVDTIRALGLDIREEIRQQGKALKVMDIRGEKISVNRLALMANPSVMPQARQASPNDAPQVLELRFQNDTLDLYAKESVLLAELFVEKAEVVVETDARTIEQSLDSEVPETVMAESIRTHAEPVWFKLAGKGHWRLRGFQAREIGFSEENSIGSASFKSAIHSGTVTILETGFSEAIREEDHLILKGAKSRRLEISRAESGMRVFFEGTVSDISVGPAGFEKNLSPTILEYFYHQKPLAIFWSTFVFLCGMLWRLRIMFSLK